MEEAVMERAAADEPAEMAAVKDPCPPHPQEDRPAPARQPIAPPPYSPQQPPLRNASPASPVERNGVSALGFAVLDGWSCRPPDSHSSLMELLGEVRNLGDKAQAVRLQMTARDAQGRAMYTQAFWVPGVGNCAPGDTCPFSWAFPPPDRIGRIELRVTDVYQW
jgi:hypothetical protein